MNQLYNTLKNWAISWQGFTSDVVEQFSFLLDLVQVKEGDMSEVFVSESSLDLHGEVIVHSQKCIGILIIVEFVSPVETDVTPH